MGTGWTITYSTITNKITFVYTSEFIFTDCDNSLYSIIGFKKSSINTSTSKVLISSFCCNFSGLTRLLVSSSTFNLHNILCADDGMTNILAVIPINCRQSSIINYTNITGFNSVFKNHEISSIQISICDDDDNFINFNNIDWSMTLQIDILNEVIHTLDNLNDIYENAIQEL